MTILVWHDKHGDIYYDATTGALLNEAARKIIKLRLEQNYFDKLAEQEAKHLLYEDEQGLNARALYRFLCSRNEYEYEGIELCQVQ